MILDMQVYTDYFLAVIWPVHVALAQSVALSRKHELMVLKLVGGDSSCI